MAKDAELVALGVGQHDPGSIPLADVHPPCAMRDQPSHLGVLVIRPEVEVESALGLLGLIEPDEIEPRRAIRRRADLELVRRGVDDNPAKGIGPPLPQGRWIQRVDNYLFPFQRHWPNLDLPRLPEQAFSLEKRSSQLARRYYRFPRPNMWRNRSAIDLAGLISTRFDPSGGGRFAACSAESVVRT